MPDHNMFKLPDAGMVSFSDPIIKETMTEQIICIPVFCEKKKTCDEASNVFKSVKFKAISFYITVI